MELSVNHVREKLLQNVQKPGSVKVSESERRVFLDSRSQIFNYPLYFGGLAFGLNYVATLPLKQTRMRWVRIPLNLLALSFGASYGFNAALEKLIVNLYSLPDSELAKEGRELLRAKFPTHPMLKTIDERLAQSKAKLTEGKAKFVEGKAKMASTLKSTMGMDNSDVWKESDDFAQELSPSQPQLPGEFGETVKNNSEVLPGPIPSRLPQSVAPNRLRDNNNRNETFHGEDAFADTWNPSTPPPKNHSSRSQPTNHQGANDDSSLEAGTLQKKPTRTWDEVRAEFQKRQQSRS